MIHRILSTLPSFKELKFGPGLNIVLADKSSEATSKSTRNGAGKSSILEIIHFILGGSCDPSSIFRHPDLVKYEFGMEFDLAEARVTARRSGSSPSRVWVETTSSEAWPIKPAYDKKSERRYLRNSDWVTVLGHMMFRLIDAGAEAAARFGPTFRSMIPYFVRTNPGGFVEPHLHFVGGTANTWQVALTYLLGLDWTIPQQWQELRETERQVEALKKSVGQGLLGEVLGKTAELRAQIAVAEEQSQGFRRRVERFQVVADYQDMEREASKLTRRINELSNSNTVDQAFAAQLREALHTETVPETIQLERLYREAGTIIPEKALRRFEEVRQFHMSVLANRRSYLANELAQASSRIAARDVEKESLIDRRAELWSVLKSGGALDQYTMLQAEATKKEAELEVLRRRFDAAEKLESEGTRLSIERSQLRLRLQQDFKEQSGALRVATLAFESIAQRLYERPGMFVPEETDNGPAFRVVVHAERSPGISHMQIFCFDMMLVQLAHLRGIGPRFLVHDSHLFDPVDSRQVGAALQIGAELSREVGFQYIVTLNSDKSLEFEGDFSIDPFVVGTRITDATETGGLFGIRFG